MDPNFQQWLLTERQLPPKVLKALQHEDVTNEHTLRAMTETDLQELAKKHKLPMGHLVILRSARDDLKGKKAETLVAGPEERRDSFEELRAAPEAGLVEGEANQREAAPVHGHPPPDHGKKSKWRQRGDEMRKKYQLPVRDDRYSRAHGSSNGASAVPSATDSPFPDHTPTPTNRAGGLQTTAQMEDLHRRAEERGQKLSMMEHKSRALVSGAMDYERKCAELAEKQRRGKKRKKKKKDEAVTAQSSDPSHHKKTSTYPKDHTQQLSVSTHTSPRRHHSSHSPSHTPSSPYHSVGVHSDPIRRQSPHVVPTYGTMTDEPHRSVTPTALSYTSDDETLHLHHYSVEENQTNSNSRGKKGCPCCTIM